MQSSSSSQINNTQYKIGLVKYDKIVLNEGLIKAYNPVYTLQGATLNQEQAIMQQSQASSDQMDLDLIQITYLQKPYLFKCNGKGQILYSPKLYNDQTYQNIFNDEKQVGIDKIAFISGQSYLFFLDKKKYVSTIQFLGQQKQNYTKKIQSKVDFLIGSHDQSSVLIIDEFRRFIIYDQDVLTNKNQITPLMLKIDPSQIDLLIQDDENILCSIQCIDYIQHETGYFIYLANQKYLYKLNYERESEGILINQIIRIDQSRGKVQKIVATDVNQEQYFEVVVVQQKSVDQYLFTKEFKTNNLWRCSNQNDKIAFDYTYKIRNSQYFHIIQCVCYQEHHMNQNWQNQLEFDTAFVFVTKN
ncbi:hypothetical protein ABPG72_018790 [Tetrahymena utriculariae]